MKIIRFLFIFLPAVFLLSCAPAYVPNVVSSPGLYQQKDVTLSGYLGYSGFDFQSAFAPANHFGILVNANFDQWDADIFFYNQHDHYFVEAAAGYFKQERPRFYWSAYAGAGTGLYRTIAYSGSDRYENNLNVYRFFVQPAAIFHSHYVDINVALRISKLHVQGVQTMGVANVNGFYTAFDPAFTIKAGTGRFRILYQFGYSHVVMNEQNALYYNPYISSFGLQINLKPRSKK